MNKTFFIILGILFLGISLGLVTYTYLNVGELDRLRAVNAQLTAENTLLNEELESQREITKHYKDLLKEVTENSMILTQIPGMTAIVSEATQDAVDSIVGNSNQIEAYASKVSELLKTELDKMPTSSPFSVESGLDYTAYFGDDVLEGVLRKHTGVDLIPKRGSLREPILATKAGQVVEIGHNQVYGKYIIIDHDNGYRTKYAHLSIIYYTADLYKHVKEGDTIGLMGNTGYTRGNTGIHLHYEVRRYDATTDEWRFIDPEILLEYGTKSF